MIRIWGLYTTLIGEGEGDKGVWGKQVTLVFFIFHKWVSGEQRGDQKVCDNISVLV